MVRREGEGQKGWFLLGFVGGGEGVGRWGFGIVVRIGLASWFEKFG